MTEKFAYEVRPKRSNFFKKHFFWPLGPMGGQKKLYHMKFKSKIRYLGEKISILPWQIAEQKKRQKTSKSAFPFGGSKKIVPHEI